MSNYWKITCPPVGSDIDFCSRCGFTCSVSDGYGFETCENCGCSYCDDCKKECLLRPLNRKKKTGNEKRTAEKNKEKNRNHNYDEESDEDEEDEFEDNCGCYDCKNQNVEDVPDKILYKYAFFKLGLTREELREMYGNEQSLHPRHACPVESREMAIRFARRNTSISAVEEDSDDETEDSDDEKEVEKKDEKVEKKVRKEVAVEKISIQKAKHEEESDDDEDDEDIDDEESDNEKVENESENESENEKNSDDEKEKKEKPKKVINKIYKKAKYEDKDDSDEESDDSDEESDDEDDSDDEDKIGSADENEDSGDEEQEEETGTSTFDPESLIKPNHRPIVVELYRKITRFFNPEYFRRYLNMNSDNDLGFYKYERFCYYQLFYLNKMNDDKLKELKNGSGSLVGYMDFEDMFLGYLSNMCFERTGLIIYLRPR